MAAPQFQVISWSDYHQTSQQLAAAILAHSASFDLLVTIARGGLTLGHLLSDLLRLPVATIAVQSYSDVQKQGELRVTGKLTAPIAGKRVLLVDDVSDTGKTFVRATAYLRRFAPRDITTVAMFFKPHSVFRPDYFAKQTTRWVIFPYEQTETILSLTKSLTAEGKTKAEIQDFFETLGFTTSQIGFVRKHYL